MSAPGVDAENPHAGGNAVVLDIGGDVGALVVSMPRPMLGLEVQLEPRPAATGSEDDATAAVHHPHRAVVDRPTAGGDRQPSLVFEAVTAGDYVLRVIHDGTVGPAVTVTGGEVTTLSWDRF